MSNRIWKIGVNDTLVSLIEQHQMDAIITILTDCDEVVQRVSCPDNSKPFVKVGLAPTIFEPKWRLIEQKEIFIADDFFRHSIIGQVCEILGLEINLTNCSIWRGAEECFVSWKDDEEYGISLDAEKVLFIAALDHARNAMHGKFPGVDKKRFTKWYNATFEAACSIAPSNEGKREEAGCKDFFLSYGREARG